MADSLENIGLVLLALRQPLDAHAKIIAALRTRHETNPRDELAIAGTRRSIGTVELEEGRYDAALETHSAVLATRELLLGVDHPLVGDSCADVASSLWRLQRYDEAVTMNKRVLSIAEHTFGRTSVEVADALLQLALVHEERRQDDDTNAAAECLYKSVDIYDKTLGRDHRRTQHAQQQLERVEGKQQTAAKSRNNHWRS